MFEIPVIGQVIAYDKKHYAQGWACRSISQPIKDKSYKYDEMQHTVRSNLILDSKIRAVPYALYYTEKGICSYPPGDIVFAPGAMAAELYYKDNITEIKSLLKIEIPSEIEVFFYNGLLTGIFSVLELFLSDVLLCLIFRNHEVYERALDHIKKKGKLNSENHDLVIQRYFTKDIVYHKFDQIKCVFNNILQIQLPNTRHLRSYLHKRNNIAHRFAFSNIDRMTMTEINVDILNTLIEHCNEFVAKIMEDIYKRY